MEVEREPRIDRTVTTCQSPGQYHLNVSQRLLESFRLAFVRDGFVNLKSLHFSVNEVFNKIQPVFVIYFNVSPFQISVHTHYMVCN